MFLSNDFYNFLYIAVIILSGITFSLTLILSAREKDEKHKALYLFTAAVFVFMIIDFIVYYYLDGSTSGRIVFAMITVSDILRSCYGVGLSACGAGGYERADIDEACHSGFCNI